MDDHSDQKAAVLILGNKVDREDERVIETTSGRELAKKHNVHFAEVSAYTGVGVEKVSHFGWKMYMYFSKLKCYRFCTALTK